MHTIPLGALMAAARALVEAEAAVDAAEGVLKIAKERARVLREETLPNVMLELEVERFTLETGETLKLSQDVYASLTDQNKARAFEWLVEHEFDGIIKTEVSVAFEKGRYEEAEALCANLLGIGYAPAMIQNIHVQTLKAFLRERLSAGTDVPLDLFNARPVFLAKLSKKLL